MNDVLEKLKFASSKLLTRMVLKALDEARLQIEAQAVRFVGAKLPPIAEEAPALAERFRQNLHTYFEELTSLTVKDTEIEPDDYDALSLVDHDYLEAMIAMEGMVKHMHEHEVPGFKSLMTRLEHMFPNYRIDQTNNPLDPEQVGDCFNEAIRPLGLKAHYLLTIYREFNKAVFNNYAEVIEEANDLLVEEGVLPNLDITAEERARRKEKRQEVRAQLEAETRARQEQEKQELEARLQRKPPAEPEPAPETAPPPAPTPVTPPPTTKAATRLPWEEEAESELASGQPMPWEQDEVSEPATPAPSSPARQAMPREQDQDSEPVTAKSAAAAPETQTPAPRMPWEQDDESGPATARAEPAQRTPAPPTQQPMPWEQDEEAQPAVAKSAPAAATPSPARSDVPPPTPTPARSDVPPPTPAWAEAEEEPEEPTSEEMFELLRSLVENLAEGADGRALPVSSGSRDELADNADVSEQLEQHSKLMRMLSDMQASLVKQLEKSGDRTRIDARSIGNSINENLKEKTERGEIKEISAQLTDVINLVTLLYEAIWNDRSVPLAIKELIGRTQITIIKVALTDTSFFDDEHHPGRALLNELAQAGIAWTATDDPESDPIYKQLQELVDRLLHEPNVNSHYLQMLVEEVRQIRAEKTGTDVRLERKIRESEDVSKNLDEVETYVTQKINERVLKGYLDPSIRTLLDTHIHDFLMKLMLKEGPNGASWKPIMSTIDVMLWTVQAEKQPGDRARFERINPRLLDNLQKALQIGGASKTKITKIMRQLKQVQEYTFHKAEIEAANAAAATMENPDRIKLTYQGRKEPSPLSREDPYLRQIDKLPLGTWFEFIKVTGHPIRASLASRIDSIDKLFFADSHGKKVVELTRMQLALELKSGSVKLVSKGALVDRAMESMVKGLQNSSRKAEKENKPSGNLGATASAGVNYLS